MTWIAATIANRISAPTWARTITRCTRADSSVPITQIVVITTMITTASVITASRDCLSVSRPRSLKM
jgi:hypothetical protein